MWSDLIRDLPQGLPKPGDQGLDATHTWGRTYWGGALFCLLADVEIRQRTHNQKGLEDALRGIVAAGGNITEDWPLERALRVGDEATGTRVLEDLYQEMKDKPVMVNLASLWRELGIQRSENGNISFSDDAPLASVRKAITAGIDHHE
jgi:predicted metalloprotease with PDZ domain